MEHQERAAYLDSIASSLEAAGNHQTAELITKAVAELKKKHWHEMLEFLLVAICDPMVQDIAYELHHNVLIYIRADISPIAYVKLVYYVCFSPNSTIEKALQLIDGASASLIENNSPQGNNAAQCIRALLLLERSEAEGKVRNNIQSDAYIARKTLESVERFMHTLQIHEVEPLLMALYGKARGRDYELRRLFTEFYKNSFDIVTYAEKAEMRMLESDLHSLAYKTITAALLSENIYNFGKLLNFKPFTVLLRKNANDSWLVDWMDLCNNGNVEGFEKYYTTHDKQIQAIKGLEGAYSMLSKKVRLMAILHLIFYTPFDKRTFPFDVIAKRCIVSDKEVEPLLLAALAQGIVKGMIDGLNKEVHITWVEPRVLNLNEVMELSMHMAQWKSKILDVSNYVDQIADDIVK